jgi:HSP20 family molecular chaperone IbpA
MQNKYITQYCYVQCQYEIHFTSSKILTSSAVSMQVVIEKQVVTLNVYHQEKEGERHSRGVREGPVTKRPRMFVKRSILLPKAADTSRCKVSYSDGVIRMRFPKQDVLGATTQLSIT